MNATGHAKRERESAWVPAAMQGASSGGTLSQRSRWIIRSIG